MFYQHCTISNLINIYFTFYSYFSNTLVIFLTCFIYIFSGTDSYTRRLEHSVVQRNGKDKPLGRSLFRDADDIRQLRFVQFTGSNFGRRIFLRGNSYTLDRNISKHSRKDYSLELHASVVIRVFRFSVFNCEKVSI